MLTRAMGWALLALGAGCTVEADLGLAVALTVRAEQQLSDSTLASVALLRLVSSGDEAGTWMLPTSRGLGRTERIVYRPSTGVRAVQLELFAEDANGALLATAASATLGLRSEETTHVEVELKASTVQVRIDAAGDADDAGAADLGAAAVDAASAPDAAGSPDLPAPADLAPPPDLAIKPPISIVPLTGGASTMNGTSFTTAPINVRVGRPVVIDVNTDSVNSGDAEVPTAISGAGLSFTKVTELLGPEVNYLTLSRWVALPLANSTGALTVSYTKVQDDIEWSIYEISGAGPTTNNGLGIFLQHITKAGSGSSLSLSLLPISPGGAVIAAFSAEQQGSGVNRMATPKAGWTEMHEFGQGDGTSFSETIQTQYFVGLDAAPSVTWTSTGLLGGLASELRQAP